MTPSGATRGQGALHKQVGQPEDQRSLAVISKYALRLRSCCQKPVFRSRRPNHPFVSPCPTRPLLREEPPRRSAAPFGYQDQLAVISRKGAQGAGSRRRSLCRGAQEKLPQPRLRIDLGVAGYLPSQIIIWKAIQQHMEAFRRFASNLGVGGAGSSGDDGIMGAAGAFAMPCLWQARQTSLEDQAPNRARSWYHEVDAAQSEWRHMK